VRRWLRGDAEDSASPRQRERNTTPCSREVIPLRSNNIVKNPIYFCQTETHLNGTGG